jgi:hypothetical protein
MMLTLVLVAFTGECVGIVVGGFDVVGAIVVGMYDGCANEGLS